jgi:hypothetical protein
MDMRRKTAFGLRAAAVGLAALLLAGCSTQRTLEIASEPPGARIWVNGDLQRGVTPVEVPFTHYGRFDVRLEKEGYRSVATELVVPTELDGYPLIDLPLEMANARRRFRQVVRMEPLVAAPTEADVQRILREARTLKERAQREVIEPGTPGRQAPEILRP